MAQAELLGQINTLQQQNAALHEQQVTLLQRLAALEQIAHAGMPAGHGAANTRVKIPKPPLFSGHMRAGHTPQNWCHQMGNYLASCHVEPHDPEAVRIAAGYLTDSALTWWRNYEQEVQRGQAQPITTWEDFKARLITRFTPITPEYAARARLTTLRQTSSVKDYAERYNLCMIELPHMDERDRIYRFITGLKPEIRVHVELSKPTTLEAAVEAAIQVDTLLWQSKKNGRYHGPNAGPSANGHGNAAPMELGAAETSRATQAGDRRGDVECYHCHKKGHFKRACPELRRKGTKNPRRRSEN
jgi:hypothetical protein